MNLVSCFIYSFNFSLRKDLKNIVESQLNELDAGNLLLDSKKSLDTSLYDNEAVKNLNQQLQLVNKVIQK